MVNKKYHQLRPGLVIPDDWFPGRIPLNIMVGDNTVIDSSFCFKNYFSTLDIGLKVGNQVTFWRTSLAAEENACIEIGDHCFISNASIVCSQKISIGNFVFIAGGVTIADSDFHPVAPAARIADTIALSPLGKRNSRPEIRKIPVVIEDDVWIGYNATILKGTTIGTGAVIQPGTVILENVAPYSIMTGNPAVKIGEMQ